MKQLIKLTNRKLPNDCKKKKHLIYAIGHFAIWASSMKIAQKVAAILYEKDSKPKGIPARGMLTIGKRKYFWCRAGFLDEPLIYANPVPKNFQKK